MMISSYLRSFQKTIAAGFSAAEEAWLQKALERLAGTDWGRMANRLPRMSIVRGRRAFTLLEVMVAVAIIAMALVTLFGSQSRSLSYATEAQFNILAPMLASWKLAEVEREIVSLTEGAGDFGEEFMGYSWKMEVEEADLELETEVEMKNPLQKIELTVEWSGSPFSYTLTSYGPRPGDDGR